MGNFECKSIEDLVFNRSFREWILSPATADPTFWQAWIAANPDKQAIVEQSKAIIYAVQFNFAGLSDESIDQEIRKILQKIDHDHLASETDVEHFKPPVRFINSRTFRLLSAAIVLGLIILTFFLYNPYSSPRTPAKEYGAFIPEVNAIAKANDKDSVQFIVLPDGSRAWLEPGSKLTYPTSFSASNREVHLTGEAFFDIEKDPSKPFLVFTNKIITKVLGTSFRVKAISMDTHVVVTVKTGKVSVFRTDNFSEKNRKSAELGGIVVTPNQAITYNLTNNNFNKALMESPALLAVPLPVSFSFDATPVKKVFRVMEEAYGVPLVYDEEIISTCSLSANLGNESFYEKLDIICKAIGATYEMIDGSIVVETAGCSK